ncbi:hypothetical protein CKO15_12905 [Halorhodospira abdelmalekii]|uniref:hypothetical protein n=1 Tax=Halorhodospira abdelmalekii TaxID=421629 RepID=UPI00190330E9|nr:hypothetical protein [Halorhodospira abdelmalekii]MBK1736154.1 hypothetical protein [Halorhodospira abdelmalekii]
MAPEPDLKVPQSPQVQCESAAEEETLSDAATPVELVPPVLNDETAIVARMTHQERNHFEIMVRLHGHDMRIGLDPDSALTPNDLEAIERYRHEIRRHNAHQARKTASEGGLKGQVGSCDRRHAEGAQADAQLVRERLSQSELVQAAAIADKYALFMGVAFLELYRQIVWHLLFNPQSRRSTFHGLRIAQRLLEQGRWGVPHSMRDDFQPPPPPPRGSERRWGEGVASGRGGGCR